MLEGEEEPVASIYRLILLTGQRGGEVKTMRWEDISGELWTIPAARTKNGREQKVPLSPLAVEVLAKVRASTKKHSAWVFPSSLGEKPVKWLSKANERLRASCGFDFAPHDLRRTAATGMSRKGVDDVTIGKILNHAWADRNVTAKVYNRWEKLPEMRRALERWASELLRILKAKPAKVVNLR